MTMVEDEQLSDFYAQLESEWNCPFCNFDKHTQLERHIELVHLKLNFQCPVCFDLHKSKFQLVEHMAKSHAYDKHGANKMQFAKFSELGQDDLDEMLSHRWRLSGDLTVVPVNLLEQLQSHFTDRCPFCTEILRRPDARRIHLEAKHLKIRLKCNQCPLRQG